MNAYNPNTLWQFELALIDKRLKGSKYWWLNKYRSPKQLASLQLTLEGNIVFEDERGAYEAGPGSLTIIVFGDNTMYGSDKPLKHDYSCKHINLIGSGLSDHLLAISQIHQPVIDCGMGHPLIDKFQELWTLARSNPAIPETEQAVLIHNYIIQLYKYVNDQVIDCYTPVDRAIHNIIKNPYIEWSVKEYAANSGCSREHLSRIFYERMETSPTEYLSKARTERALSLLLNTNLKIKKIAELSGFRNVDILARQVGGETGMTPTEYRTLYRNKE
ncbi:helix-turn-helix transcriptional regulator [Planctomycetota bacterium]|nr:helix-turn-helix transcriptional regulator [Planctomycetota bacterium]